MIYATICSGIEAPSVAWEDLGWRPAFYSEIEAFPREVLEQRQCAFDARRKAATKQGTPIWGDFTTIRVRHLRRLGIRFPDVLCGGTPCQDFSIAGMRAGLKGARGNLTLQFVRLCHALNNARRAAGLAPLVVVWENVPGVLSDNTNAFGCFLGAMVGADGALVPPRRSGWTDSGLVVGPQGRAAWRTLDAQFFRLAQRRERVFVVFCFGDGADPSEILFEPEGVRRHSPPRREAGEDVAGTLAASAGERGAEDAERGQLIAGTLTSNHGNIHADDAWKGNLITAFGGNNTAGPIDVATARSAHAGPHGRLDFESETFIAHTLRAEGFDASEDGTGRGIPLVPIAFAQNSRSEVREIGGDGQIVGAIASEPGVQQQNYVAFDCKAGGKTGLAIGDMPGALRGDGHGGGHAAVVFTTKDYGADAGDIAPTLRAMEFDKSHANGGGQVGIADASDGVRRLTPRECERLQGFPDDYTLIQIRGKPAADGPRYRAIGNSMAVRVMRWLGARINAVARVRRGSEAA